MLQRTRTLKRSPHDVWQDVACLIDRGAAAHFARNWNFAVITVTTGGVLYVLVVLKKLLVLILTSLMVTGFTGLLRGNE